MKFLFLAVFLFFAATTQAQTHTVILNWQEDAVGVTFNMYRAPGACSANSIFAQINTTPITTTTYTDTVSVGIYCYVATAVDASGNESPQSNQAGAIVRPAAPVVNPPNSRLGYL